MDRDLANTIENLSAQELTALMQFLSLVPDEADAPPEEAQPRGRGNGDYNPLDL